MSKIIAHSWHNKGTAVAHIIDRPTNDKAICGTRSQNWSPWTTDRMKVKVPSVDQQCVKCRRLADFAQVALDWEARMHAGHTAYMLQRDLEWAEMERQGRLAYEALTKLFQERLFGYANVRLFDDPNHGLVIIYAAGAVEITLGLVHSCLLPEAT
jgi:hypothetical protein